MGKHRQELEAFWSGQFGDEYSRRNRGRQWIAANTGFFARILSSAPGVASVLELGANIGQNLEAIGRLLPGVERCGVELNSGAAAELRKIDCVDVHQGSLLDFAPGRTWDLTFTKGVLIHLHPDDLAQAYRVLHRCSARYLLLAEYYSPTPVEISYRGHEGRLFKRDFAGELLETYADLELRDYGFAYRRDSRFAQDDLNWFLLEKRID